MVQSVVSGKRLRYNEKSDKTAAFGRERGIQEQPDENEDRAET